MRRFFSGRVFPAGALAVAMTVAVVGTGTASAAPRPTRPVVSLHPQYIRASEADGPAAQYFTVEISRRVGGRVRVDLTVTGTAVNGQDVTIPTRVFVPAGMTSFDVPVHVVADAVAEDAENFEVRIARTTNNATPDRASVVTGMVTDLPVVSLQPVIDRAELCPDRTAAYVRWIPPVGHNPLARYEVELYDKRISRSVIFALTIPGTTELYMPIPEPAGTADDYLMIVTTPGDFEYAWRGLTDGPCTP